jgi:hypothetical protein
VFAGYGASPPGLHGGDLLEDTLSHVAELGLEDRSQHWYSRLFVRAYAPFGDTAPASVIVGASVGLFHLSKKPR